MPNAQNKAMMDSIKADIDGLNAAWVVDYRGLTVKEVETLRNAIREADASMKVYKNTLVRIALNEHDVTCLDAILEGPSAFIFCKNDPVASAKALTEFAKGNEKLVIKGGMMEGNFVSPAEFQAVASLPTREELYAKIAGAISGVACGLAVSINGVPSGLAQSINQVSEKKSAA